MNVQYLREFLVFHSHMNFTAAARELFISQPTLSSHIAALEKELDVELINHGRTISLTHAGRVLVDEAPHLIRLHDETVEKCRNAALLGGTITILRNHGSRSCNDDNFGILIGSFMEAHPEIFVHDVAWDGDNCFNALDNGEADCICANFMPPLGDAEKGVSFIQAPNYVSGRFCLWVDESHPLAQREEVSWSEVRSLKIAISAGQLLNSANTLALLDSLGISIKTRITPEFGWGYMRSLADDEVLVIDTGFIGYESLKIFERRKLVPVIGPDSECNLYLGYLPENENRALCTFLNYIESQKSKRDPEH